MSDLTELRGLDTPLIVYAGPELRRAAGLPGEAELVARLLDAAVDYLSPRQHQELGALATGAERGHALTELARALSLPTFCTITETVLDDAGCPLPPLAEAIARLGPRLRGVITPNLDIMLERAFEGQLTVFPRPVTDIATRKGWLLKLAGTLNDRATWVLTGEQRGAALYVDPTHREIFRTLFLGHPILFVATRLDDPLLAAMVAQIEALAQGHPPRHWALVPESETGPINRRRFAAAGIRLIPYADEGACLAMLDDLAGAPIASSVSAPAPAPAPVPASGLAPVAQPPDPDAPCSILFVAANPSGTDPLRIDRELRLIRDAIERSRQRTRLELDIRTAATVHDLRRALLDKDYAIVHISGHGEQDGLLLEDEQGRCVEIPRDAIARLMSRHAAKGALRAVLINACFSTAIGESSAMAVSHVVAMAGPISDAGAAEFARGFYDALGAGMGIAEAYEEGMGCVDLAAPGVAFDCRLLLGHTQEQKIE